MPFDSTTSHDVNNHSQEGYNTDYQRIRRWIEQLEFFRASLTPLVAGSRSPSTASPVQWMDSEARNEASTSQGGLRDDIRSTGLRHRHGWAGICGPISERNYPPAPLMLTIPLPQVNEENRAGSLTSRVASSDLSAQGRSMGLPSIVTSDQLNGGSAHQPHHRRVAVQSWSDIPATASRPGQQPPFLAIELRHHELIRPVVKPVLCDMPPYSGHCWGAREEDGRAVRGLSVHFPDSAMPATNPPLARIRLARPFGGVLIVTPAIGNQFVSVGDVQRMVVAWMRWEQPHVQDEGLRLTGRMTARAQDGTQREVNVWVWRGLTMDRTEADVWKINL
jgi:hypothetical protein